jgi:hypothetical protein
MGGKIYIIDAGIGADISINTTGIITASSFVGNLTGTATGLSGTPSITVTGINASGITTVSAGSTSAPSISPSGDSNTGIFFPSADTLAASTGGSGRLTIDSSGNINIDSGTVYVDAVNNRFGIGTTSPDSRLHIQGLGTLTSGYTSAGNAGIKVDFGTATNGVINLVGGADLGVYRSNSSGAYDVGVGFGDNSNRILRFDTAGFERARIDSSGRFGIGTISPLGTLSIQHGNTNPQGLTDVAIDAIRITQSIASGIIAVRATQYDPINQPAAGDIQFLNLFYNGSTYNWYERMRITAIGRVGIGITNPRNTLDVNGSIFVTAGNQIQITGSGGAAGLQLIGQDSDISLIGTMSAQPLVFRTGANERARIDSSGRLLVGTTSTSTNINTKLVIQQNNAPRPSGNPEAALFLTTGDIGGYALQMGAYNSGSLSTSYTWISSVRSNDAFDDGSAIPPLAFLIANSECMRINSNKELLVGYTTDNGNYKLQVNSQIFATSSTIATSDGRYKKNVAALDGCLDLVKALRPVSFDWKPQQDITRIDDEGNEVLVRESHNFPDGTQVGFIAQEVQEVLAEKPWLTSIIKENVRPAVTDNDGNKLAPEEKFLGIAEGNLIAVLTSALQEAIAKIEQLEAAVTALQQS